jgi:hypothetical protein
MMHYVRLSGVNDRGITDPLDYRSEDPTDKSRTLMKAIGDRFNANEDHEAEIIPLDSRRLPRLNR